MGDQSQDEQKLFKIVIIGGGGVGKSCITLRFLHDHFEEKYNPTIEDSYMKNNFMISVLKSICCELSEGHKRSTLGFKISP